MKLTRIDILNYKSITQPVSIVFNDGKIVSIIGKNGSGKTNVLEAIKLAFKGKGDYYDKYVDCNIQYRVELSDEEMKEYFPYVEIDDKSKEIIVEFYNANEKYNVKAMRYIASSAIRIEAQEFKSRLEAVVEGFKKSAEKYIEALKKLVSDDTRNRLNDPFSAVLEIESNYGMRVTHIQSNNLKFYEDNLTSQVNDINNYIDELFEGDQISLDKYEDSSHRCRIWSAPVFKIKEEDIYISPIIASYFKLSEQDVKKATASLNAQIREINRVMSSETKEIQKQLDEFDKIQNEIETIFRNESDNFYKHNDLIHEKKLSIIQKLQELVYSNCYYLDNENTLLFNNKSRDNYDSYSVSQNLERYMNSRNPIAEAFNKFLQKKSVFGSGKGFYPQKDNLSEAQLNRAIDMLNKKFLPNIVPKFDGNEIEGLSVEYKNKQLELYVHEKNGEIVSFSKTSLGRRWYLTYRFIKELLNPGDILFIDEPAAFLHPYAQVEIKNELIELGRNGIYVIYTTHSPYMIPEDWGQIYNVTMTDSGTQITKFESGDELCEVIKEELGVINSANILFNLGKTLLLVEGPADMACIEKFAEILKYDLSEYKILPCNGSPIFDVTYLCIQQGIKFKALFDLDNKKKPEGWMKGKYGYKEYLNIFENNKDCVFTPDIRQSKSLEDCFHENDNDKYFYEHTWKDEKGEKCCKRKIDREKIKKATAFEEETKKNFEQLFIQLQMPKLDMKK